MQEEMKVGSEIPFDGSLFRVVLISERAKDKAKRIVLQEVVVPSGE